MDENVEPQRVELPPKLAFLFQPKRYKVAHGGRGSAKSWSFARALILRAYTQPLRILCCRELQTSIHESVHHLLETQIDLLGLRPWFAVEKTTIRSHVGSEFIFAGLRNNVASIKSMEDLDIAWAEEAAKISDPSWQTLIPTVRKPGSEIWVTFNPEDEDDPTYKRFVVSPPPNAEVVEINWQDNPWFPETLRVEKDFLASVDLDAYEHVWGGKCRKNSAAQIFAGKCVIQYFEPGEDWDGPYYGVDFGFSVDPSVMVKCWIHAGKLYVEHEAYGHRVEIDALPALFDKVPRAREYAARADSARPETISYLQRNGFDRMEGVEKWKGSVEDGIAHLRGFEQIVIHQRCTHTAEESRLYSYKVDKLSGDVLPDVVDAHNHCWDAIRYALNPIIRNKEPPFLRYIQQQMREAEIEKAKAA